MNDTVLAHYGLNETSLLGSGWESTIYALGPAQILRLPRAEEDVERQVRAQAAFTDSLPPLPFAVPKIREISRVAGHLVVIEDRIEGRALEAMLPGLSGARRREALSAYLAVAEAMVQLAPRRSLLSLLQLRCPPRPTPRTPCESHG